MSRATFKLGAIALLLAGFTIVGANSNGQVPDALASADTTTPDTTTTILHGIPTGVDMEAVDQSSPDGPTIAQLGGDILSPAPDTSSCGLHVAVSADGNVLAVAVPGDSLGFPGAVRVHRWTGADWGEVGPPITPSSTSVVVDFAADGGRMAVGGSSVRVHEWSADTSTWSQVGADVTAGTGRTDVALSADGNRLAVGRTTPDGAAIYDWDATNGDWRQVGDVIQPGGAGDASAINSISVALSSRGDRVAVGASFWDEDPEHSPDAPLVALYQLAMTEATWVQVGPPIPRSGMGGLADIALAGTGDRVAIGTTPQLRVFGPDESEFIGDGVGRAFDLVQATTSWNQAGEAQEGSGIWFGRSIDLSDDGERMVVGGTPMRVYDWEQASASWRQINPEIPLGDDVDLSADGSRLAFSTCYSAENVVRVLQIDSFSPLSDQPSLELPGTGGGTTWLSSAGLLIAAGCLALLSTRRRAGSHR